MTLKCELVRRLAPTRPVQARRELTEVLGIVHEALADVRTVAGGSRRMCLSAEARQPVRAQGRGRIPRRLRPGAAGTFRPGLMRQLRPGAQTECSQPASRAIRMASTRLRALSLLTAEVR
ncbi:hypothetical protein ACIBL5_02435 [Streptomyces sp. NPDC050516]|uniref:hypothetical protein n=1 Tax=Streptomyces sp. NPDC050516 TaxID=3365621 RepID=UPI0037A034A1